MVLKILMWMGVLFFGCGIFILFKKKDYKNTIGATVATFVCLLASLGVFDSEVNQEVLEANQEVISEAEGNVTYQSEKVDKIKTERPLKTGENGYLGDDVFVGIGEDKTNFEEMYSYINNDNSEAFEQMINEGRVVLATKGAPITVVDRGFLAAKIQLIETGERGWVPVEVLARFEE